ncbi:MAG TPA: class I SAM-dependent methyltransferase, partial [Burkholderiales bacterium]|nr:class I SAM-dependent methyltransferase [Burkholderiales bacterium]
WAGLIRPGGRVLDVATGHGRHLRYLRSLGFAAVGIDRDEAALAALKGLSGIEIRVADIEVAPWPFASGEFDGVVVTNYLHRPLFPDLVAALRPGGVLIYETFAVGNERYGRPSNPAFLLRPGELLHSLEPLAVVAFEEGLVSAPKQAVVQRVCAVRGDTGAAAIDSLPAPRAR